MDGVIGEIVLIAMSGWVPTNWLPCRGQILAIELNVQLYSLVGTTYGGNGKTYFALPDLRNAAPLPGLEYVICVGGAWPF